MHKTSTVSPNWSHFCMVMTACLTYMLLPLAPTLDTDQAFAESVSLPPPPAAAPPPVIAPENDGALTRKNLRLQTQATEEKSEATIKEQAKDLKKEELAKAEAKKPRPLYGFTELSLLQPKAVVSLGRSNYVSDLTVHSSTYVRLFWDSGAEVLQPWLGIRIAPFGGTGTQSLRTSRYALTWIGPAIGFGKISTPADTTVDFPVRYGFLFSAGIAGLSRLVARDEAAHPLPTDFAPTPWVYDSPGLWSEIRCLRITMGAIGLGGLAGIQTGTGKIFYYGGMVASGFY
jgi:hypothetical protein